MATENLPSVETSQAKHGNPRAMQLANVPFLTCAGVSERLLESGAIIPTHV